ncbi:ABC transporter permease [Brevibacillus sp. B_LB10_24]|uniref:ABC transporter permease n=1 Tax=Brevibacillus sp. B_LB10_24 TaxID=3380645 RepID=UPI0038BE12BD
MNKLVQFIAERYPDILWRMVEHVYISLTAVVLGFFTAVPLGILLSRSEKWSKVVIGLVNTVQTIPSLALIGFLIPFLGIGLKPAIGALFLYSLLPMLRNTYVGIREVNPALKEAAKGMGMTGFQTLIMVEIPMAIPVIMSGFRTATIYTVSWATLAALVGGGGIGYLIFTGLWVFNNTYIIVGALATALLAILADWFGRKLQKWCTPAGLLK